MILVSFTENWADLFGLRVFEDEEDFFTSMIEYFDSLECPKFSNIAKLRLNHLKKYNALNLFLEDPSNYPHAEEYPSDIEYECPVCCCYLGGNEDIEIVYDGLEDFILRFKVFSREDDIIDTFKRIYGEDKVGIFPF